MDEFKLNVRLKIWFESEGETIIGTGVYNLLKAIRENKSLTEAAEELGYSYKYAWSKIKKTQERTGQELVIGKRGGSGGGGSMELAPFGRELLGIFEYFLQHIEEEENKLQNQLNAQLTTPQKKPKSK